MVWIHQSQRSPLRPFHFNLAVMENTSTQNQMQFVVKVWLETDSNISRWVHHTLQSCQVLVPSPRWRLEEERGSVCLWFTCRSWSDHFSINGTFSSLLWLFMWPRTTSRGWNQGWIASADDSFTVKDWVGRWKWIHGRVSLKKLRICGNMQKAFVRRCNWPQGSNVKLAAVNSSNRWGTSPFDKFPHCPKKKNKTKKPPGFHAVTRWQRGTLAVSRWVRVQSVTL